MCALCGVLGEGHWAEAPGQTARATRSRILRRVLEPFNVALENWGGVVYPLRGPGGTLAVADDLGSLWIEAERLTGRPLDPLDPAFLDALEA